jgi:TolB-like protein/tetratricopeptide (TPR) repeat protein
LVIVLTLALGLLALYVNLILDGETRATSSNPATVAVLPFKNNSPDPNDQYLADAISDDLINRLSTLPQLRITNRRSTQEFRGELGGSYDLIARELKVNTLLTGSLQRVGNELIVRAQLIDGKENRFIWGNTYHRTTSTFMTVQRDIVLAITRSLGIGLNDEAMDQLSKLWTSNDTAYFHYQRGRSLYYRYRKSSNDSAVQEFKQAIQADPTYALAWAGLGDAYSQIPTYGGASTWQDSALVAGERAIALDSTLADGYKAMANAYNYKKLYDKAFPLLKKAVELSPSNPQAVGNLGTAYFLRTQLVEALELQKRSAGLTPKNWIPYQIMGWIYGLAEEREKAIEALQKSLELNPYHQTYELLGYNLVALNRKDDALALIPPLLKLGNEDYKVLERAGLIAHFAGDEKAALQYFKRSIENNQNYASDVNISAPIGLGQLLLKGGRPVEADVLLTHALETYLNEVNRGSQDDEPPFRIAAIYAIRGDKVEMIRWLERAVASNWIDYSQVLFGPWFADFRNDPDLLKTLEPVRLRVQEMRKKIN